MEKENIKDNTTNIEFNELTDMQEKNSGGFPKLTNKTDQEFEKLVSDNLNFAYFIVEKEYGKYSLQIKEDLKSAATSGLVYAAIKYDITRKDECKFISYAVHWVRYYIQEELRNLSPIKLNQSFVVKRNRINKFIDTYKKEHNNIPPTHEEIATGLNLSKKIVDNCLALNDGKNYSFIQFTQPMNMDSDNTNDSYNENRIVKEYLDNNYISDTEQMKYEVADMLNELKKQINDKEYEIFYSYYFNDMNYTELKKKYNFKNISEVSSIIKNCEKKCKVLLTGEV